MDREYIEKLAAVEQRASSNTHRLNDIDDLVKSIHSISTSVQIMATELKTLTAKVNKVEEDMEAIKSKPNKLLDSLTDKSLGYIITAILAAVMALILK